MRERLLAGDAAVVQALHGMGGVGKTQLAAEYAHRFAGSYDLAWWINAEQAGLIGDQVAALGLALGCVPGRGRGGAGGDIGRAAQFRRWLLIFDNAEDPADVAPWLPGGGGHVLITSRQRGWNEVAASIEVDVLARAESVAISRGARITALSGVDAARLAAELGDLPLAIAQAAAARDLNQDILDRRWRVLGQDHPDTLNSAGNLASDLRELGEVQAARDLNQDTLDRRLRVLGQDHPDTLNSAGNLASDLRELG